MGRLIVLLVILSGVLGGCGCGGGSSDNPAPNEVQPVGDRQTRRGVPENIQKQSQVAGGMTK